MLCGFEWEEVSHIGLWDRLPERIKTWEEQELLAFMASHPYIAPPMGLNFANSAQRALGIHLTAADYLRLENLNHTGLCVAASQALEAATYGDAETGPDRLARAVAAAASVALDGGEIHGDAVEFERLVVAARPAYEAGDAAGIRPLANWLVAAGCGNVRRAIERLAAQLGWKSE
jgi:hypothetical protein